MTCEEFWKSVPDGADTHPHLRECAACVARMRRHQQLRAGFRAMAATVRVEAPARVEARLMKEFRSHAGIPELAGTRRRWVPAAIWGGAIAAMIAAGIFLVRDRAPEAQRPVPRHMEMASMENPTPLDAAIEEGFVLLPGAEQLETVEDLNLLHVELPRSAMMQVGIDVSPERGGETVRADVMVGSDGLARAVRFVDVEGSD